MEKKIPKKRGRKPKENKIEEVIETKPKKRGRKPKEKIISNSNPVFSSNNEDKNIIIKINPSNKDKQNEVDISHYEKNYDCNCKIDDDTVYKSEVCWNCCINLGKPIFNIPLKNVNQTFYGYGDFCSLECCARYTFDNFKENEAWNVYSLINYYYNLENNTINKKINIPPNKLLLRKFGGNLSYEEYFNNKSKLYDLKMPIIIVYNQNQEIKNNNMNNTSDLKLKRKNAIKKDNLFK